METFAPEFSRFWLGAPDLAPEAKRADAEDDAKGQQAALEELAYLVNAARSVV